MFNKNFYPTPIELAKKMIQPYAYSMPRYALEPSAGKGDIADLIADCIKHCKSARLHCIEIEPELQATLRGKKHNVIADDFLAFEPIYLYSLIIANPPFENGDRHFLKAWSILADGGNMCFLLNAETIKNAYTHERQLVASIIEQYGTVEYLDAPFAKAERKTSVEVALIRVKKPSNKYNKQSFGFEGMKAAQDDSRGIFEQKNHTEIAKRNTIANSVHFYNEAQKSLKDLVKAFVSFTYNLEGFGGTMDKELLQNITRMDEDGYNDAASSIRNMAWKSIFELTKIRNRMSSAIEKEFDKHQSTQTEIEFTQDNVLDFLDIIIGLSSTIKQQCIEASFDWLTSYDKKNKVQDAKEGWKTNSHYKVNKKVIVPGAEVGFDNTYERLWSGTAQLMDGLDKALCFVTGKKFEEIKSISSVFWGGNLEALSGAKFETEFFYGTCYLKGTMHLVFKDDKVLEMFNYEAAKHKKWLG